MPNHIPRQWLPYAPLVIDQFDYDFGFLGVKRFGFDGFGCCFRGLIKIYCGFLFLDDFCVVLQFLKGPNDPLL